MINKFHFPFLIILIFGLCLSTWPPPQAVGQFKFPPTIETHSNIPTLDRPSLDSLAIRLNEKTAELNALTKKVKKNSNKNIAIATQIEKQLRVLQDTIFYNTLIVEDIPEIDISSKKTIWYKIKHIFLK